MKINDLIKNNQYPKIIKWKPKLIYTVYFICEKDGSIIYIGSTANIENRLYIHNKSIRFCNKSFFYFGGSKKECQLLEQQLICKVSPAHNHYYKSNLLEDYLTEETKEIRKTLTTFMKEKNINQTCLSKKLGISRQRISQIMIDKRNLTTKTIKKIKKALATDQTDT